MRAGKQQQNGRHSIKNREVGFGFVKADLFKLVLLSTFLCVSSCKILLWSLQEVINAVFDILPSSGSK